MDQAKSEPECSSPSATRVARETPSGRVVNFLPSSPKRHREPFEPRSRENSSFREAVSRVHPLSHDSRISERLRIRTMECTHLGVKRSKTATRVRGTSGASQSVEQNRQRWRAERMLGFSNYQNHVPEASPNQEDRHLLITFSDRAFSPPPIRYSPCLWPNHLGTRDVSGCVRAVRAVSRSSLSTTLGASWLTNNRLQVRRNLRRLVWKISDFPGKYS